jgi:hypothetical protein
VTKIKGDADIILISVPNSTSVCSIMTRRCSQRLKKGSINQRIGFRLGSGWIHHSSHIEVELWTLGIGLSDTRVDVDFGCRRRVDGVDRGGDIIVGKDRICSEELVSVGKLF